MSSVEILIMMVQISIPTYDNKWQEMVKNRYNNDKMIGGNNKITYQ